MKIRTANRLNKVEEYYFSTKLKEVAELKQAGNPIINIAIGSPDLQPPVEVVKALEKALLLPGVHQYQSYRGIPELRQAMAGFYENRYGVSVNPEDEILPLMGSKEGIMHVSMAFLNAGDQVLIPDPGYPTYAAVAGLLEAEPVSYPLNEGNNWFPDLEQLEEKDLSKVRMMWICYPHMPTGASADLEQLTALIAFARKHELLLVNDNPYSFILNEQPLSLLQVPGAMEVALELNSLSKTFNMAGWRVGMLVGRNEMLNRVLQVKSNMDSGMFQAVQWGAVAALQLGDAWFEAQDTIYRRRRELVWKIFDVLGCTYDRSARGLFVWARLPEGKRSESYSDELLYRKHVFIAPGTVFGKNGEGYIRASLCVDENQLNEVLKRFKTIEIQA
jgi:aspartate/methionine/tyrosine aminotransferase